MKISMRALNKLTHEELLFVFRMMQKYGGLTVSEEPTPKTTNKNKKRRNNRRPHKKEEINHDDCSPDNPCLYDFKCPSWNKCDDEKFLQFRMIMQKCE